MIRCMVLGTAVLAAVLGGCSSGDLSMEMLLVSDMQSAGYFLSPDGKLALRSGGGLVEGVHGGPVYQTQLDPEAMDRLKQVIHSSGFFLADAPRSPMGAVGPSLHVSIELGLWSNQMDLCGATAPSVDKIIAEMNRHLPEKYRLVFQPRGGGIDEDMDQYLR